MDVLVVRSIKFDKNVSDRLKFNLRAPLNLHKFSLHNLLPEVGLMAVTVGVSASLHSNEQSVKQSAGIELMATVT